MDGEYMRASLELEDIEDGKIKISCSYTGSGEFDTSSPSHREIKNLMHLIKHYFKDKGYKNV